MHLSKIVGENDELGLRVALCDRLYGEVLDIKERHADPPIPELTLLELSLSQMTEDPLSLKDLESLYQLFVTVVERLTPQVAMPTFGKFCEEEEPIRDREIIANSIVSAAESLILGEIPELFDTIELQYRAAIKIKVFAILGAALATSDFEGDPLEDLEEDKGWEILALSDSQLRSQNTDLSALIITVRADIRAGYCESSTDSQVRAKETKRILKSRGLRVLT